MDRPVPEQAASYPEARMFGRLPAYGFYCRHVSGIKFDNVRMAAAEPDQRPALHCEDVKDLRVDRLDASAPLSSEPLIRLVNVQGGVVAGCSAPAGTTTALEIDGAESKNIRLVGNDFSRARSAWQLRSGAPAGAVAEAK